MKLGALKFEERYFERIWAGNKLKQVLKKPIPKGKRIGEAWLIADHPACESIVVQGAFEGQSLRHLMEQRPREILGASVMPDKQGRFPLLLKLIDAGDVLSVQVHPDDALAARLSEPDGGKTEMWYILDADPQSRLVSGWVRKASPEQLRQALSQGEIFKLMRDFPVVSGDGVLVRAGAVHAIGAGILLAEIQQNSDITYRLFDWNRKDSTGKARELHFDKALQAIHLDAMHGGRTLPLRYREEGVVHEVLAACQYFAVERLQVLEACDITAGNESFHIILALNQPVSVITDSGTCPLRAGEAALVPGIIRSWQLCGNGAVLDYYVPNLFEDIVTPLRRHGYADEQIALLGGAARCNELHGILH